MIAAEELEKAGLRAGGSLDAPQRERGQPVVEVGHVEHEVLHPERRALAHRGELRRLEVGVAEGGLVAPSTRELAERAERVHELRAQQLEAAAHQQEVGVVGDVRARGAEMNERARRRRHIAERMNVGHDVVAEAALVLGHALEVEVVEVGAHLGDRLVGDLHPERSLGLGQREPQRPPERMPRLWRPDLQHRARRIALGERRRVPRAIRHRMMKSVE